MRSSGQPRDARRGHSCHRRKCPSRLRRPPLEAAPPPDVCRWYGNHTGACLGFQSAATKRNWRCIGSLYCKLRRKTVAFADNFSPLLLLHLTLFSCPTSFSYNSLPPFTLLTLPPLTLILSFPFSSLPSLPILLLLPTPFLSTFFLCFPFGPLFFPSLSSNYPASVFFSSSMSLSSFRASFLFQYSISVPLPLLSSYHMAANHALSLFMFCFCWPTGHGGVIYVIR